MFRIIQFLKNIMCAEINVQSKMPPLLPFNMANPLVRSAVQVETSRIKEAVREVFKDNMAELKSARDTDERKMEGLRVQNRQRRQRIRALLEDLKTCRESGRTSQAEISRRQQMLTHTLGQLRTCNQDTDRLTRERDEAVEQLGDSDDLHYIEITNMRILAQEVLKNNRPGFDNMLPRITSEPAQAYKDKMVLIFEAIDQFRLDNVGNMDQVADLQREVEREKKRLEDLQAKYDRDMAAARQNLGARTSRLENAQRLHEASTADLSKMRDMATAVKEGKEQLVNSIRAGIQSAPGQAYAQTMQEIFDALQRCIELDANRAGTDGAIADLRQQVEAANKALAEEQQRCAKEIEDRQKSHQEVLGGLNEAVELGQAEKENMKEKLKVAEDLAKVCQDQSALLQQKIQDLDADIAIKQQEIVAAQANATTHQESLAACQEELAKNKTALAEASAKGETGSEASRQLAELNTKFIGIEETLKQRLQAQERMNDEKAKDMLELSKQISGLNVKLKESEGDLKRCKDSVKELEQSGADNRESPGISRASLRSAGKSTSPNAGVPESKGSGGGGGSSDAGLEYRRRFRGTTGSPGTGAEEAKDSAAESPVSPGAGAEEGKDSGSGSPVPPADAGASGSSGQGASTGDDELEPYITLLQYEELRQGGRSYKTALPTSETSENKMNTNYVAKFESGTPEEKTSKLAKALFNVETSAQQKIHLGQSFAQRKKIGSIELAKTNVFETWDNLRKSIGDSQKHSKLVKSSSSRYDPTQIVRLFFLIVYFEGLTYQKTKNNPIVIIFDRRGSLEDSKKAAQEANRVATAAFDLSSLFVWL